jgi:hypothetical protein
MPRPLALATTILTLALITAGAADAGQWSVLEPPSPGDQNVFNGVAGNASGEVWAVGATRPLPGTFESWFTHFDGSTWQDIPLDGLADDGQLPQIDDVVMIPGGDVLLVGNVVQGLWHAAPMAAVYSGGSFTDVAAIELSPQTAYPYNPRSGAPLDALALAADDLWIVGTADGNGSGQPGGSSVTMALHFDGSTWTEVATPNVGGDVDALRAIDGVASDDLWGVGDGRFITGPQRAWVLHWDGSSWSHVPSPPQSSDTMTSQLQDVVAIASDDVWAAGHYTDPIAGEGGALFLHWDGASWTEHRVPTTPTFGARGMAALASDDLWAAAGGGQNAYFHFDGQAWSLVAGPAENDGLSIGRTDQAVLGFADGSLLSFGVIHGDGFASEVLVERWTPDTTTAVDLAPASTMSVLAYPNPFNPRTTISLDLARAGHVRGDIYDARGRLVRRLMDEARPAGTVEVAWDGRDDGGRSLASGTYLASFAAAGARVTTRLTLAQ